MMPNGYDTYIAARGRQADALRDAVTHLCVTITDMAAQGVFTGRGPTIVGIGASFAAAAAPVWALRARGVDAVRLPAGDLPLPYPDGAGPVIGVSQSGRSAETIAVLESVASARRVAVVNATPSPVADVADRVVGLGNLYDSYASTIGYTATVAALGIIADVWDGGTPDPGWARTGDLVAEVDAGITSVLPGLGSWFRTAEYADFVGGGPSAGSAEAGALLFREVARLPSTGMSTRQYLHGSMESAGAGVHVVLGEGREAELASALAAAGHRVVFVTAASTVAAGGADGNEVRVIRVPDVAPAQRALLEAVVLQNLVHCAADARGVDIEEFVFHNSDTKVTNNDQPVGAGVAGDEGTR